MYIINEISQITEQYSPLITFTLYTVPVLSPGFDSRRVH